MLCPLDDRYKNVLAETGIFKCMTEYEYTQNRVYVEMSYLKKLVTDLNILKGKELEELITFDINFDINKFEEIKHIEKTTNHDVKAIEIYLRNIPELSKVKNYIHFGLTSQDVNSMGFMIDFRECMHIVLNYLEKFEMEVETLIGKTTGIVMCAKTHAQFAVPTFLDKEIYCKYIKIHKYVKKFKHILNNELTVKIGGAVGLLNAHKIAYPSVDWITFMDEFANEFNFKRSKFTTQIDDYTAICDVFDCVKNILFQIEDLNQYCYCLINDNYFTQQHNDKQVGSSTMPQKINPIELENAKGNISISTGIIEGITKHLRYKISYQRDISDSTIFRNVGMLFGYVLLISINMKKGLSKLNPNIQQITADLDDHPEIIMEGIQTYLKTLDVEDPYNKAKEMSRGKNITLLDIHNFIDSFDIQQNDKDFLKTMRPCNYVGIVQDLQLFY